MRARAEITPKVGVAHKISQCILKYPKHPPTINPGSAPDQYSEARFTSAYTVALPSVVVSGSTGLNMY